MARKKRSVLSLAFFLLVSCAFPQANVRSEPPPRSPAAQVVTGTLDNESERYLGDGGSTVRGDAYIARWAVDTAVSLSVSGEKFRTSGIRLGLKGVEWLPDGRLQARAGKDVPFKILTGGYDDGPYELVLDPRPDALLAPADVARVRVLAKPEDSAFALDKKEVDARLSKELAGFALDGQQLPAPLERFRRFELQAEGTRCYRVLVRLTKDARFSDVARRGVTGSFKAENERAAMVHAVGSNLLSTDLCPREDRTATFEIAARAKGFEGEIGSGPIQIEVWSKIVARAALPAKDRDAAIAKATRGLSPRGPAMTVRLDQPLEKSVKVGRGECLVAVLKLAKGAKFGKDVRDYLRTDLELPHESVSGGPGLVGPGAVSSFGCQQRAANGTLKLGSGPMGTGTATLQLYSRSASEAQLRREASEDRAERLASNRRMGERRNESCQVCVEEKVSCARRGGSACYEAFFTCVRSKGYRETECGG